MESLTKCIGYAIHKLEHLYKTECSVQEMRKARYMKKRLGVNYSRYCLFKNDWLKNCSIETVIDIGANVGELTAIFAELFPSAQIYAFEPLPDCFEQLAKVAEHYQGRVKALNIALGAKEGNFEFHRSSWAPASSFRKMSELHKENYPHSAGSETIKVDVTTLDDLYGSTDLKKNIFIKMDVQGFEDEVIKGGLKVIGMAKVLVIECSLQETYEDEPMFEEIYNLVQSLGFEYRGSLKQSVRKDDQSFLQADCVFMKREQISTQAGVNNE